MQHPANDRPFQPREERRRTVLSARLRNGGGWSDACILNISSRGLMIYAKTRVQPGTHVELRRGGQLIFARVIWRKNQRLGLSSSDQLPVEDIIISSDLAAVAAPAVSGAVSLERRNQSRDPERSRARARAVEFLSLVLLGTALAGLLGAYLIETFGRPIAAAEAVLGSR